MTDTHIAAPAPAFDSGKALGFIFEVIRAKPGAVIALSILQIVLYAAANLVVLYALAGPGAAFMQASAAGTFDPATAGAFYGALALGYIPFIVIFCIVEASWLRLTVRGIGGLAPNPADVLRVFLGFLLIIVLGALILALGGAIVGVAAAFAGQVNAVFGFLVAAVLGLLALFVLIAYCVRVSPIVALSVLERRFAFGAGFGGAGRIFWSLLGAWFLVVLVLLALSLAGWVVMLILPGAASAVAGAGLDASDPAAQFRAMGALFESPAALAVAFAVYALMMAISLPGYLLSRGVASKAALHISAVRAARAAPAAAASVAPADTAVSEAAPFDATPSEGAVIAENRTEDAPPFAAPPSDDPSDIENGPRDR